MSNKVTPQEKQQARSFLQSRGIKTSDIPPAIFAATAKKTKKTYAQLLKFIAELQMGGQGSGQSPKASKLVKE